MISWTAKEQKASSQDMMAVADNRKKGDNEIVLNDHKAPRRSSV
jgi:hypothetical protein